MRAISYPPFIVFFDTVAVFLFLLILNQSAGAEFVLPPSGNGERIFEGAQIVYRRDNNFFFEEDGKRVPIEEMDAMYFVPCKEFAACRRVSTRYTNTGVYVFIPEGLHAAGAKFAMVAVNNGCSSIQIYIAETGEIDRERTYQKNACVQKIANIEHWVKSTTKRSS